ncbi:MAG: nucleotide disphospho-sugar-binding domain-containing protein [Phormidesmis sp.]
MANIVCITGGLTGIFNASLALIEQLIEAGHQVIYASPAKNFSQTLAVQGIPFVQLDEWVIQSGDPPMSRWQKWRQLRSRQNKAVTALGTDRFVDTLTALSPDLVLIDIEMHPHIMAAVKADLPVALLCPFLSIWKCPGLPPISSQIVPNEGWRSSPLGLELSWLRYGLRQWGAFQRERWRRMGLDRISILQQYAKQLGYQFRENFGFTQWLVPYPHGPLPILCLNAQALDFPHQPPASMHYIGPMVAQQRLKEQVSPEIQGPLNHLFQQHRTNGRSLIYCGCSSFKAGSKPFLQQVIAAVANRPEWDLVVGLGGRLDPKQLGPLPNNVYAFSWTPQLQVLAQADCAIINSGPHSIAECIHFGVPMLVYSLAHACQNGSAARVKYHGLGIVGSLQTDQAADIRRHIQALLDQPGYRHRVNDMRDRCQHYANQKVATQLIETLISQKLSRKKLDNKKLDNKKLDNKKLEDKKLGNRPAPEKALADSSQPWLSTQQQA